MTDFTRILLVADVLTMKFFGISLPGVRMIKEVRNE